MRFNGSDAPGVCMPTSVNRGMVTGTRCGVPTTIMRTSVWAPDITCPECLAPRPSALMCWLASALAGRATTGCGKVGALLKLDVTIVVARVTCVDCLAEIALRGGT